MDYFVAFVLNVALIPFLRVAIEPGGIVLAAAVSKALKVLLLLVLFGRRVPAFHVRSFGTFAGQMTLAALATTAMLLCAQRKRLGDSRGYV